jgi:hypothetical protein
MPTPTRVLVTVSVGAAAILGWQSYGDTARQIIANLSSHFDWLAPRAVPIAHRAPDVIGLTAQTASSPDQHRLNVMSLDFDVMRENVDRIATTQERITRSIDRLSAGQEQMTREIAKLQAVEQQILHKNSEPPPRPAPALARKIVPRSAQAPAAR